MKADRKAEQCCRTTEITGENMEQGKKKTAIRIGLGMLGALLLLILACFLYVEIQLGRIGHGTAGTESPVLSREEAIGKGFYLPDSEPVEDRGCINILLLGTDFRLADTEDRGRADTNMLCSMNLRTGDIRLVSFERGISVPIPGQGSDLLTHAYSHGGAELSQCVLETLFALHIDGYIQVDFETFARIIDEIGGIDVELTQLEADALNGAIPTQTWTWEEVHEGWNHLCGHDALEYCRLRSIDSDWGRQARQRNAMAQIQKAVKKAGPLKIARIAGEVVPSVNTNLSLGKMNRVLFALPLLLRGDVTGLQVPDKSNVPGVVYCNLKYESEKIADFLYGEAEKTE